MGCCILRMRVYVVLLFLSHVVLAEENENFVVEPCPCHEFGALVQTSSSLAQEDSLVTDVAGRPKESVAAALAQLNPTPTPTPDLPEFWSADNTTFTVKHESPTDENSDAICVCKRVKKPVKLVRCTKRGLLAEEAGCNREQLVSQGYELAPQALMPKLYPDMAQTTPQPTSQPTVSQPTTQESTPQPTPEATHEVRTQQPPAHAANLIAKSITSDVVGSVSTIPGVPKNVAQPLRAFESNSIMGPTTTGSPMKLQPHADKSGETRNSLPVEVMHFRPDELTKQPPTQNQDALAPKISSESQLRAAQAKAAEEHAEAERLQAELSAMQNELANLQSN